MAADWQSPISGMVGSGTVHLAGMMWIIAALAPGPMCHCGWGHDEWPQVFKLRNADPAFYLAPSLLTREHIFEIVNVDCGERSSGRTVSLLGSGAFSQPKVMRREPRLCVRVEPNGQVTSARVLTSSGNLIADAAIEAHARALVFAPARAGELQLAVTVTLDVTDGRAPVAGVMPLADQPTIPPFH